MNKLILLYSFIFFSATGLFAQDLPVPDYRSKREFFKRLQEPHYKNELAAFTMGGIDESMGKKPLNKLEPAAVSDSEMVFENEDIKVVIKKSMFNPKAHRLQYLTGDDEKKYLVRIDNKAFFGNYGFVPVTEFKSIEVIFNDRDDTVFIPQPAFADLYNLPLFFNERGLTKTRNAVYLSNDGKRIYIYLIKPDTGKGSYEATFIIDDRKYIKRVVDFGF